MKALITGGAGFIGSNFALLLQEKGHSITILDNLTYAGGIDTIDQIKANGPCNFIKGDICDPLIVDEALKDIDTVFNFAAESHNTRSETNPDIFYKTNVEGTKNLLEHSFKNSQVKKFIHISTDEVYGSKQNGYFKESDKLIGDSQATSAYSKSKSLADDLALKWGEKFPVTVTRTTNNFGPYQYPEKALPRFITNLLTKKKIPLWGKGEQIRDWLYVKTNCEAILFIAENGSNGEAYNIAANHEPEITNKMIAEMVCKKLGLDPSEWIEYVPDLRPDHDFRYALDVSKIKLLGFNFENNFDQELSNTIDWYKNNSEWWMKRKAEAESIYKK